MAPAQPWELLFEVHPTFYGYGAGLSKEFPVTLRFQPHTLKVELHHYQGAGIHAGKKCYGSLTHVRIGQSRDNIGRLKSAGRALWVSHYGRSLDVRYFQVEFIKPYNGILDSYCTVRVYGQKAPTSALMTYRVSYHAATIDPRRPGWSCRGDIVAVVGRGGNLRDAPVGHLQSDEVEDFEATPETAAQVAGLPCVHRVEELASGREISPE